MLFNFKKKSPQERIRIADKKIQGLIDRRSRQANPNKKMELNKKIHRYSVEKDIAFQELKQPQNKRTVVSAQINFNKNDNSKSLQFHAHRHKK